MGSSPSPDGRAPGGLAGQSLVVAFWTIISRVTGMGKLVAIAAILGPTYLGNTFQSTNELPNLVYYGLLAGSLFPSLLVPSIVRHLDSRDARSAGRLAGGFLGVVLVTVSVVAGGAILLGPVVMRALAVGVENASVAADQRRVGWLLLAMVMPQVALYAVAGTAGAVMNAYGRFAVAAGASTLENVGIMTTLVLFAVAFGPRRSLHDVSTAQLMLLGFGTTASVGLHAATQWWGARRLGIAVLPRFGWHDPEVRAVIRRAVPTIGSATLFAFQVFAAMVVANRVPGGVVAFSLAYSLCSLPVAVAATPVAVALLPELARTHHDGDSARFRDQLLEGVALATFFALPAAVAYAALAHPIAAAVSFGRMSSHAGVSLVAASLAALAVLVPGEAAFQLAVRAAYARHDVRTPLVATAIRTATALLGMTLAFRLHGTSVLVALGLATGFGAAAGGCYLAVCLKAVLPAGQSRLRRSTLRTALASLVMLAPAGLVLVACSGWTGRVGVRARLGLAGLAALTTFLALQWAWASDEIHSVIGAISRKRSEPTGLAERT